MKRKKKITRKPCDVTLVNFKVSLKDLRKIKRNAKKYTEGNMSAWIRYAAMNCIK